MELSKDDLEFFETAMTDQEAADILRNMIKNIPAPRADTKSMIKFTFGLALHKAIKALEEKNGNGRRDADTQN